MRQGAAGGVGDGLFDDGVVTVLGTLASRLARCQPHMAEVGLLFRDGHHSRSLSP